MGRIFNLDSPFMAALSKIADLIILNLLTMFCCIPIITVGASMTALHYVLLKMAKNEEGYIFRSYFKSFKENFKEATLIWLILLLAIVVLIGDFVIFRFFNVNLPGWMGYAVLAVAVLLMFATVHLFPVLARFDNNIVNTYKNSLFIGILNLPKTILMMVCWIIPLAVTIFMPQIFPIVICLGISGPAYLNALLYKKSFKRFEPETEEVSDLDWTIAEEGEGEGRLTEEAAGSLQEAGVTPSADAEETAGAALPAGDGAGKASESEEKA